MDIESLKAPLSPESPSGEDLSYDSVRQEIEAAFERAISDAGGGDEEIDWNRIVQLICAQAETTRDLWLPVYLMRAGVKSGQFDVVETGAELLAGLLENLWDSVHPQLEEYGFLGRRGPTESLVRFAEFLGPMRKVPILRHGRLGEYSGEDFERFRTNGDAEPDYGMFRAVLEDSDDEGLMAIVERLTGIDSAIRRADEVLTANSGSDGSTNFQPTYDTFAEIIRAVSSFVKGSPDSDGGAVDDGMEEGVGGQAFADGAPAAPGSINSREDVIRAIDAITAYYARKEPGSPVPFALRRARDWVSLDFLEVLEDIAPNSLDEAKRVLQNGRSGGSNNW